MCESLSRSVRQIPAKNYSRNSEKKELKGVF